MKLFSAILAAAAVACATAASGPRDDWQRVGRSHPRAAVEFSVAMPNSNLEKLDDLFWKISTPGNPMYGKHMSFEAIDKLTATPADTVADVKKWLDTFAQCTAKTSTGFRCLARVEDVERALATKMFKFLHEESGRLVHKVDAAYTVPSEMEGKIDFISGLNLLPMPHMAEVRELSTTSYSPTSGGSGGGGGGGGSSLHVVPGTIKSMYNLGSASADGIVQAAFEFQDLTAFSSSDLSTFLSNTGAPNFDVEKHFGPFQQFPPQAESTLDVQYLGTIGSGATNYYYTTSGWMYEMTQDLLSNSAYGIDVVSMSYGWSEAEQCEISPGSAPCSSGGSAAFVKAVNTNFQKLGAAGVTLLAASGDAGAHGRSDLSCSSGTVHPGFPAASPYITAVGATQLGSDAKAGGSAPICQNQLQCAISGSEIVSSTKTGSLITSGGGFSLYADRPSYQDAAVSAYLSKSGATPPNGDFNSAGRGYPDVAALGHSYYIELDGEVQSVDGTSAACPVFAGVLSQINAARVKNGGSKIGFANPLLYAAWAHDASSFNDVTSGNNKCTQSGSACCSTGFEATSGWDATTGLGTPNYAKLVSSINEVTGASTPQDALAELIDALRKMFPQA